MAIEVTQGLVAATFTGYIATFNQAFQQADAETWYRELCTLITAGGERIAMPVVVDANTMREWIGDRVVGSLESSDYSFGCKPFEKTLGIKRTRFEDDTLGLYAPHIMNHAYTAAKQPDRLVFDAIDEGESALCFDGRAFFATNHPTNGVGRSGANFSNLHAAKPLTAANFEEGCRTLRKLKHPNGKDYLGVRARKLTVGPDLEDTARKILERQMVVEGGAAVDNLNRGRVKLVVSDEFADLDDGASWTLSDDKAPLQGLICWTRQPLRKVTRQRPDDPSVFDRDEYLFGADMRMGVGYGLPQVLHKFKAT